MLLTLLLIWFVSRAIVGPLRTPHRRGARDVAAPAARAGRVAAHRWRRRATCSRSRIEVHVGGRDRRARPGVQRRRGGDHRGRAGAVAAAAQGHGRPVREPRPPQPEPARAPARAARRARAQRARPRRARRAVQARPHGDPHAPQRREPARALRRRAAAPVAAADRARSTSCAPRRPRSPTSPASSSSASTTALAVSGRAVSDVAHLLAELLENATVVLAARRRGRRVGRGHRDRVRARGVRPGHRHAARAHRRGERSCSPTRRSSASRCRGPSASTSSGRSPPATASRSSCAPVPPVGLVALVDAAHRGARAAGRCRRPAPAPAPAEPGRTPRTGRRRRRRRPLGARRVVSRPPDEPPVEEWRREGLADGVAVARHRSSRLAPCDRAAGRATSRRRVDASPSPRAGHRPRPRPSTPVGSRRARRRAPDARARCRRAGRRAAARRTPMRRPTTSPTTAPLPDPDPGPAPEPPADGGGDAADGRRRPAAPVPRARAAHASRAGQAAGPARQDADADRRRAGDDRARCSGHAQEDGR